MLPAPRRSCDQSHISRSAEAPDSLLPFLNECPSHEFCNDGARGSAYSSIKPVTGAGSGNKPDRAATSPTQSQNISEQFVQAPQFLQMLANARGRLPRFRTPVDVAPRRYGDLAARSSATAATAAQSTNSCPILVRQPCAIPLTVRRISACWFIGLLRSCRRPRRAAVINLSVEKADPLVSFHK